MKNFAMLRLGLAMVAVLPLCAEVIDPGKGSETDRGRIGGADGDVEVRSGIVSARFGRDYSGTVKVTGGTLVITDQEEEGELKVSTVWDGGTEPIPFEVKRSDDQPWLNVEPSSGVLTPGTPQDFRINLDYPSMTNRHEYRGVFFVRTTNGLSRPVSVLATTDIAPPFHAEQPGDTAIYADLDHPVSGSRVSGEVEYEFDVAVSNVYYFMIHGASSTKRTVKATVDGVEYPDSTQQLRTFPTWTMITPGKDMFTAFTYPFYLDRGKHYLRLKLGCAYNEFPFDGVVLTDNPESFEPR